MPYLSGERTPHNNPNARGAFFGFTHQHGRPELGRAVLEGVGFALAEGMDALHDCGVQPESIMLIGGGARSALWRQMLADISGQTLDYCHGGEVGPALGAARLAQQALYPAVTVPTPVLVQRHQPDPGRLAHYQSRRKTFATLYQQLLPLMK
jgi:xylulokinase